MTFDWSEYLKLAQELAGQTVSPANEEAKLRSSVSRAYYPLPLGHAPAPSPTCEITAGILKDIQFHQLQKLIDMFVINSRIALTGYEER